MSTPRRGSTQHSDASGTDLDHLARLQGVDSTWVDENGSVITVGRDTLLSLVGSVMDERLANEADVREALATTERARRNEIIAPFIVAEAGKVAPIELAHHAEGAVLLGEDGSTLAGKIHGSTITIDDVLPAGLYTLTVGAAGGHHVSTVLVTPDPSEMAVPPPVGIMTDIAELRDRRDREQGAGHVGLVGRLAEVLDRHGIGCVRVPSILPRRQIEESGHEAVMTRRGWSEWIIDVAAAPGAAGQSVDWSRAGDSRDAASTAHRDALTTYSALVGDHPALRAELDRFLVSRPHVGRYARFMALGETLSEDWRRWPAPWKSGDITGAPVDERRELYHQVAQWQADVQLRRVVTAMHDRGQVMEMLLEVAVHPHGYDYWHQPHLFSTTATIGRPPSRRGPSTNTHAPAIRSSFAHTDGYRSFASTVRHQLTGGLLHLPSLEEFQRSWWIPVGAEPSEGGYVRLIHEELLAIVRLEAHRAGAMVVMSDSRNTDLVTPFVRRSPAVTKISKLGSEEMTDGRFRRPLEHVLSEPGLVSSLATHRSSSSSS
jgi:hypothetical protein